MTETAIAAACRNDFQCSIRTEIAVLSGRSTGRIYERMIVGMKVGHIIGSVLDTMFKIALMAVIVVYTYKYAMQAYAFGYRVFAEEPVSSPEAAKVVSIYIPKETDAMEIGKVLEEKGLIKDARIFLVQELLSGHHGELNEGTYELSSAMTPEEMIKVLTAKPAEEEEEEASGGNAGSTEESADGEETEKSGDGAEEGEGGVPEDTEAEEGQQ